MLQDADSFDIHPICVTNAIRAWYDSRSNRAKARFNPKFVDGVHMQLVYKDVCSQKQYEALWRIANAFLIPVRLQQGYAFSDSDDSDAGSI